MTYTTYKPEWAEEKDEFASFVMTGVKQQTNIEAKPKAKPAKLTAEDYIAGILNGDRMLLAKAITIVESNAPKHFALGQEIIQGVLPYTGNSIRIGITGVPGAGKSTFIEAFGTMLCNAGHKVAVLAVDPSSSLTKGSILGDKTRMENLAKEKNAFIRPSPAGGTLGGVNRKSRETMLLCEAFGYDVILVETVGVGQSETTVRSMVDFFLMIALTGGGDELQGIKKGIMELSDAILVNKSDGDNKHRAFVARGDYEQILHYLRPATRGWTSRAYTCSSITGEGVGEIWQVIERFKETLQESGYFNERRQEQTLAWVRQMVDEYIYNLVYQNAGVQAKIVEVNNEVSAEVIPPTMAAKALIDFIAIELKK